MPATNISSLHVFEILRLMRAEGEARGVSEVSRRMGLPPSTVHRAFSTLEQAGFLRRTDKSTYELGDMPQILARALFHRFALRDASQPFLRRLAAVTGETASLTVRVGWYGMQVTGALGGNDIYHPHRIGQTSLLHVESESLAILAFLQDREVEQYRRFVRNQYPGRAREIDRNAFLKEIRTIRSRGFATELTLLGSGYSVSLPVRDAAGAGIAAIHLNGPVLREQDLEAPDGRLQPWLAIRDELEALIAADPQRFRNPYAHLEPDEIRIQVSNGE